MKYSYMQDAYFMQLYNDFCIFFPISFHLNIFVSKFLYKYFMQTFICYFSENFRVLFSWLNRQINSIKLNQAYDFYPLPQISSEIREEHRKLQHKTSILFLKFPAQMAICTFPAKVSLQREDSPYICGLGARFECKRVKRTFKPPRLKSQI